LEAQFLIRTAVSRASVLVASVGWVAAERARDDRPTAHRVHPVGHDPPMEP
jgi:hypothetical protein